MTAYAIVCRRIVAWLALCAATAVIAIALIAAGLYVYVDPQLPDVAQLQDVHWQQPLRVYASNGELMAVYGAKRRFPVDIDAVPQRFRNAFIAAEDNRFHEHPGVDWMGIVRAAWNLALTGEKSQGGSTITMQVARNFFLTREKTYIRKIREIFLALRIHRELPKAKVLELYVNKIYLGEGAYGIAAAAQAYYGKNIDELTVAQMATIAGLPKAPSYFNPVEHPKRALDRRNYVLRQMRDNAMIGDQTLTQALKAPIRARSHAAPVEVQAPYAAEMARREAFERYGEAAYTRGYNVYTTVVPHEQRAAVDALRTGLLAYEARHGYAGSIDRIDDARLPSIRRVLATGDPKSGVCRSSNASRPISAERAVDSGRSATQAPGALTRNALNARLAKHASAGALEPAVVLKVERRRAIVYRRIGGLACIPWKDMKWAAPRRANGGVGPSPDEGGDVLAAGDVIHVSGPANATEVDLAQRPGVQGALVALDPHDGAIRALVGGFDFTQSRFNRVTQARRQPGSTFKPFVYSAALNQGFTAATLVNDAPVVFDDAALERTWRPENYSGRVFGPTRLREGLVHSRNLVSLRVLRRIGVPYALDYVQRFGFRRSELPHDLTLALGSASVTPLQLARAYAVFANMGYRVEPYLVTRITDFNEATVYRANPATACEVSCRGTRPTADAGARFGAAAISQAAEVRDVGLAVRPAGRTDARFAPRVIAEQNAYLVRSFLRDVARRGTAQGTRVLGRDDIGAKTGTTDMQRDAWFAGFNSSVVATAWVGYDAPRSLGRFETGARAAMPIWLDFMRVALAGTAETWPALPPGMVTLRIDPETGEHAAPSNERAVFETFRSYHAPADTRTVPGTSPSHLF